jgi:hypothetical protein
LKAKEKNDSRKAIERQKRAFDSDFCRHIYARAQASKGKKIPGK